MAKKKKKKTRKGLSKGIKVAFVLLSAVILFMGAFVILTQINKAMNEAKTVDVTVDMELGKNGDGPGQFHEPWAVATDAEDHFYVTDFGGNRVQKFNSAGEQVMVFGKSGKAPGEFNQPSGLFVDSRGNIFVCDTFNHRIEKFDSKGNVLKVWSHGFFGPRSITGDNKNRIYVVDTGNHKVQVFDTDGAYLMEWGGPGTGDGKFREPVGSAVDQEGFVYIADSDNLRIQKFGPTGKFISAFKVSPWRGKNEESPYLAVAQGFLFTSNASSHAILKYDLSGKLLAIFKKKDKEGFYTTTGVAVDHSNHLYAVERGPGKVARFPIPLNAPPTK